MESLITILPPFGIYWYFTACSIEISMIVLFVKVRMGSLINRLHRMARARSTLGIIVQLLQTGTRLHRTIYATIDNNLRRLVSYRIMHMMLFHTNFRITYYCSQYDPSMIPLECFSCVKSDLEFVAMS